MNRKLFSISITETQLLQLHQQFQYSASFIDKATRNSQNHLQSIHAFGAETLFTCSETDSLQQFQNMLNNQPDWYFGCLSYDLKEELMDSPSNNDSSHQLPHIFFFCPEFVIQQKNGNYTLHCDESKKEQFDKRINELTPVPRFTEKIHLQPSISKGKYQEQFSLIQEEIQYGNVYEMNFCQEFFQQDFACSPIALFSKLVHKAQAPFMAFIQKDDDYLLSASPERYLKKENQRLISQPIKGTAKRGTTQKEDQTQQKQLQESLKEQTENVMIVDLVRNDLGKCCEAGSVKVSELLKIYTYPTVHQLVSTIEGRVKQDCKFSDIIEATFPMGSMTGAPKHQVVKLTEQVESFKRNWYSGAAGYITPNGDFDFNVVIRSFLYNSTNQLLTYGVGGGITSSSTVDQEYEECLVKVNSLVDLLNSD